MELNPNILSLKESATLKINQQVLADRKRGESTVHFGFGQSPFPVPRILQEELRKNAHQKDYLPTQGLWQLRERIAQYYQQERHYQFEASGIVIGPGSKELIFQSLFILQGAILIPAPSWVSYGPQVQIRGRKIHPLRCDEENHYKLQAADLANYCHRLNGQQKVLIINTPNNPTGAVYGDDEIAEIAEVCKRYNIIIISDEIYGDIDFSERPKKGFFSHYPEGTLVTGGLSKAHSAGGWRLGFLATSFHFDDFLTALSSMISETYSAVSAPIQYAAIMAYSHHPEIKERFSTCRKIHACVGTYMASRLRQMGASVSDPQGAFYLLPSFEQFKDQLAKKYAVKTSAEMAQLIYQKVQVAMLPASDFYMPEEFLGTRISTVDYNGQAVLEAAQKVLKKAPQLDNQFVERNCPNVVTGMDRLTDFFSALAG